jgi:hypothetical protein
MDGSVFHPPPEVSAALTERLLEAMRRHPGAGASALAGVLKISKNAIAWPLEPSRPRGRAH